MVGLPSHADRNTLVESSVRLSSLAHFFVGLHPRADRNTLVESSVRVRGVLVVYSHVAIFQLYTNTVPYYYIAYAFFFVVYGAQ